MKRSGKFVIYLGKLGFTCSGDHGRASQVALVVKNPPAKAGGIRDVCLITGLARSPGGGHGNPLQYSCLENPRDGGAWWAAICGVAQSRIRLKRLSSSSSSSRSNLALTHEVRGSEPGQEDQRSRGMVLRNHFRKPS